MVKCDFSLCGGYCGGKCGCNCSNCKETLEVEYNEKPKVSCVNCEIFFASHIHICSHLEIDTHNNENCYRIRGDKKELCAKCFLNIRKSEREADSIVIAKAEEARDRRIKEENAKAKEERDKRWEEEKKNERNIIMEWDDESFYERKKKKDKQNEEYWEKIDPKIFADVVNNVEKERKTLSVIEKKRNEITSVREEPLLAEYLASIWHRLK